MVRYMGHIDNCYLTADGSTNEQLHSYRLCKMITLCSARVHKHMCRAMSVTACNMTPQFHMQPLFLYMSVLSNIWPQCLRPVPSLQVLDLSNNGFAGMLPDACSSMQQLLLLNLSYNHLSGSLPASWASMTSLQVLDISNNSLQVSAT
jgi:hypothetical protein